MTPAVVLGLAAGVAAAAGIVELAASAAQRRGSRRSTSAAKRLIEVLAGLGRRLGAPAAPADLGARIEAAGAPLGLGVGDAMAVKGGGAALALLAGVPLAGALPGRLPLAAGLALPLGGFLAPDLLLARRARTRARAIELELPEALDLLRVCVEAGLPLARALGEVGRRHRGLLAAEWGAAAAQIELGIPSGVALARLARRCPGGGTAALAVALQRAQRHGAPLSETLLAHAREARAGRARRLRDRAARASPKIQLVVALLLEPAAMLLVAAALVASLTN